MDASLSLWIVEDERRYREPLERLIAASDAFRVDEAFARYEDVAERLVQDGYAPDLIVMDLQLPGQSGIDGIADLRRRGCTVPVLVLTSSDDPASVFGALRAGAAGYVVKGTPPDTLLVALQEATNGGTYLSPSVARYVLKHFAPTGTPAGPLTPREQEVLHELARGLSKARIADALYLSPHTVDSHMRAIYRKLHARTAAEATATAVREGLI